MKGWNGSIAGGECRAVRPRNARIVFVVAAVLVSCSASGCAGRNAAGASAAPALVLPTDMVLMPITDERPPQPDAVDISRDVRNASIRLLHKHGYVATPRDELEKEGIAAPTTLNGATGADLAALGPRDAGPLVFVGVDRVDESYGYGGYEYRVVLSAVIVDPTSGKIVWQGTGTGTTSLGGFFRIFSPQSTTYDAVYESVRDLFWPLPKVQPASR
jgi:hypothetical protein